MVKTMRAMEVVANCLAMGDETVKRGTRLFDCGHKMQSFLIVQLAKMESASRYLVGRVMVLSFHKTQLQGYVKRSYSIKLFGLYVNNHAGLVGITYNMKHSDQLFGKYERGRAGGSAAAGWRDGRSGERCENFPSLLYLKKSVIYLTCFMENHAREL